ncbi:MAG: YjbQ family protein [Candidatus Omnitrophica bacterium]|nr:YjbQ family protein [Candidatus Omnitrophota bacterium]MBL7210693.1 YjbQ family protein [Candidatus Omnitrophota bacterium]
MKIINERVNFDTKGNPDLINITGRLNEMVAASKLKKGMLNVFVVGSTAAITTFEYEPGLTKDMQELYERIIPRSKHYHHDQTWGDANGFSHLRAALTGPALLVPFEKGRLLLGTWQQVVLAEFDNRPRKRELIVQIIGE